MIILNFKKGSKGNFRTYVADWNWTWLSIDVWLPEVLSKVPLKDDVVKNKLQNNTENIVLYLFNIVNLAVHNLKQNKDLKTF